MAAHQTATPVASPTAQNITLTGIAFQDPEMDGQFLRTLDYIFHGGADIGECFITARRVDPNDISTWYTEWMALGDRIYGEAEASLAAGHHVSARDGFYRASAYYRTALDFLYRPPLSPEMVNAFQRQRDTFRQAAALGPWTFEIVEVPYENTTLPGYLMTPGGDGPFPTVILVDGYDGTMEETYFSGGAAALKRGYAVLLLDGPGQGGALIEQGLVFRPDWEAVVTPEVDFLLTRPEVDPDRIVLLGRSWGGYLAPRAATAEHRVAALIADAAQYSPGTRALALLPEEDRHNLDAIDAAAFNAEFAQRMADNSNFAFSINRGLLVHGAATPLDFIKLYPPYTIEGLAGQITCPSLICEGENDVRGGDARPLYDAITAPKEYILFTNAEGAGQHDEAGAAALFSERVFDWLDRTLA
jgi:pimeloyl-ACP methyl ester carboxylesterase